MAHVGARDGEHKIDEHAAIEREIADGGRFDDITHARVDGVKNVDGGSIYLNAACGRSEFQSKVEGKLLAYFEAESTGERRETVRLHRNFIVARQEAIDFEHSSFVAGNCPHSSSARRSESYGGTRDGAQLRIGDHPA